MEGRDEDEGRRKKFNNNCLDDYTIQYLKIKTQKGAEGSNYF